MENMTKSIKQKLLDTSSSETFRLFEKIKYNLNIIFDYLEESYLNNKIFLSFNGGKDCTASLIIIKYFIFCKHMEKDYSEFEAYLDFLNKIRKVDLSEKLILIYFLNPDTYIEETDYCYKISKIENCRLISIFSDYKSGLYYLIQKESLKSIFMGIRKDDNAFNNEKEVCKNDLVQVSDGNYPNFTRIYPIFQFDYNEVWRLILQTDYSYLKLYDYGFTSLGRKSKTLKNGSLLKSEFLEKNKEYFRRNSTDNVNKESNYEEDNINRTSINERNTNDDRIKNKEDENTDYFPAYCLNDLETERSYRKL